MGAVGGITMTGPDRSVRLLVMSLVVGRQQRRVITADVWRRERRVFDVGCSQMVCSGLEGPDVKSGRRLRRASGAETRWRCPWRSARRKGLLEGTQIVIQTWFSLNNFGQ
jgi:hypothetical protein